MLEINYVSDITFKYIHDLIEDYEPSEIIFHELEDDVVDINNLFVIANMIQSGQLNANTLVWKQGMPQWEPITNVPDFAPLFSNNMPPAL